MGTRGLGSVALVVAMGCGPASSGSSTSTGAGSSTGGGSDSGSTGSVGLTAPICEGEGTWAGGGGGRDASGDGPVGMSEDMPLPMTIPEIKQGQVLAGDRGALEAVVVISPLVPSAAANGGAQEMFVQDLAGGPWSGLRVLVQPEGLDPVPTEGDLLYLEGTVASRGGYTAFVVDPFIDDLQLLDTAALPAPVVVSVADLGLGDDDGRPYEGIPIRVEQVQVTDDDPCEGEFVIDDVARVDDRFVSGGLSAPPTGTMLGAVEGVLTYSGDALEIAPRASDVVQ